MRKTFENAQNSPLSNFCNPTHFAEHGKVPRFSKCNFECLFITRMSYIFIHMDHWWHLVNSFLTLFQPKCSLAISMATGMHMYKRSVDSLVLCHHDHDWNVSAKSATVRATNLCKI